MKRSHFRSRTSRKWSTHYRFFKTMPPCEHIDHEYLRTHCCSGKFIDDKILQTCCAGLIVIKHVMPSFCLSSIPLFLRGVLRCKHVVPFIFLTELIIIYIIRRALLEAVPWVRPFFSEFFVYSAVMYQSSRTIFSWNISSTSILILLVSLL